MAKQTRRVVHKSLPYPLLGATLAQVRDADAWWADRSCLIFMALTCVRSNEARQATWDEVDMDADTWTVPGSRRKTKVSHRVPLSTQAVELLRHARAQTDPDENRIFPPQRGSAHITASRLSILLRKLQVPTVQHGFRSSYSNWAGGQILIPECVTLMVLGLLPHPDVRMAFKPMDFFKDRQHVMQTWADYVTQTMGPVAATTEA